MSGRRFDTIFQKQKKTNPQILRLAKALPTKATQPAGHPLEKIEFLQEPVVAKR
jgi:hypothetical protein